MIDHCRNSWQVHTPRISHDIPKTLFRDSFWCLETRPICFSIVYQRSDAGWLSDEREMSHSIPVKCCLWLRISLENVKTEFLAYFEVLETFDDEISQSFCLVTVKIEFWVSRLRLIGWSIFRSQRRQNKALKVLYIHVRHFLTTGWEQTRMLLRSYSYASFFVVCSFLFFMLFNNIPFGSRSSCSFRVLNLMSLPGLWDDGDICFGLWHIYQTVESRKAQQIWNVRSL